MKKHVEISKTHQQDWRWYRIANPKCSWAIYFAFLAKTDRLRKFYLRK